MADDRDTPDRPETAGSAPQQKSESPHGEGVDAPPPGPPTAASNPDESPPEPQLQDIQSRTDHYHHTTINTVFNAGVSADAFTIGGVAAVGSLRKVNIEDEQIRSILKHFTIPPAHTKAAGVLDEHRIVVLSGEAGSGRRCAAFALLARPVPIGADEQIAVVEFAPRRAIAELLDHDFKPGARYVLTDYPPHDITDEQLRFDLDELCTRIRYAGSFIVVTTTAPAARFHHYAVPWLSVDCRKILDTYLSSVDRHYDEPTIDRLREIAKNRRPREMNGFFDLLTGDGPDAVEQHFQDDAVQELRNLLAGRPTVPNLLPLVAAAFLPGAEEKSYELHLDRLRELIDEHAHRDPSTRKYAESLEQSRSDRAKWVTARDHPLVAGERTVALRGTRTDETLLVELRQYYGRELWKPVHDWLIERPGEISDIGDEVALATGMATFARVDPVGADAVLDSWAQDNSLACLWAAAATVSALCGHEATIHEALKTAARWSREVSRKKVAAALSFGQALGRFFPVHAVSYLWFLSLRENRVARPARNQFVALLRAASSDDNQVRLVLSVVEWQLEQVVQIHAHDERLIGKALETVSALLSTELPNSESLTQHVLRRLPDQVGRVGTLWAEVIRSWQYRSEALDHLQATHAELHPDETSAFATLGNAVQQRLDLKEWQWACRDLAIDTWLPTTHREVTV